MFGGFDLPLGDVAESRPADGQGGDTDDGPEGDEERFDPPDAFVPEHLPDPGQWLRECDGVLLSGDDHVETRRTVRTVFENRGVRDATFGYVLTKLERDRSHPDAGLRYARDGDTLYVEFTPTTQFCPQGSALAVAVFRALVAERDDHDYDRVRVRVDDTYHASDSLNHRLRSLAEEVAETGSLPSTDDDRQHSTEEATATGDAT